MHGLRGRAFILSQDDFRTAEQEVRSGIYFSVSSGFCSAAPRNICPQRSPTSFSLEIEFKRSGRGCALTRCVPPFLRLSWRNHAGFL